MTPSQQSAVQAVYTAHGGGTLTAQQVTAIGPMVDARNDAAVADYLSTGLTKLGAVNVTSNAIMAAMGAAGATALDKLEAAASSSPPVKWAMRAITTIGLNAGDPVTQGLLDQLATGGVITAAEAASLKALGVVPVTIPFAAISAALNAPGV